MDQTETDDARRQAARELRRSVAPSAWNQLIALLQTNSLANFSNFTVKDFAEMVLDEEKSNP